MNIFKILFANIAVVFLLSGCGGGGESSGKSTITVSPSTKEVTFSNQEFDIEVKVFDSNSSLYDSGNIKIIYPDDVKNGRDVGSFTNSEVSLSNGVASFQYTAPSNLSENIDDIVFKFYLEEDPTLQAIHTVEINPEQSVLTDYKLVSNIDDNTTKMNLNSSELINFSITNSDDLLVENSRMISVKVTSKSSYKGTLEDLSGKTGSSLTILDKNNISMKINSKTESGIISLFIEAKFLDLNDNIKTITKTFDIVVLSGPPSAMSISSSGSIEKIVERAKYIEKFVLTVTDKYGNLVDTNPAVSMGIITGFTQASSSTDTNNLNYLYVPTGTNGGTIDSSTNSFIAKTDIFDNVDINNDVLVTFGTNDDGYTYNASGKWDILYKDSNTIWFKDDYNGENVSNLGFAVGKNNRQITCSDGGEEAVANAYPENNDPSILSDGSMIINIEYDYYLVGKTVMLWVNLIGEDHAASETVKMGEVKKIGLLGEGLTVYPNGSNDYNAGDEGIVRVYIQAGDTGEYYRNGRFGYSIEEPSDDLDWELAGDSMKNDLNNCNDDNGLAYVDINIISPAPTAGTINLVNILPIVGGEF